MGDATGVDPPRRRWVTIAAEVFVWMVLAAFVEVLVTATIERWSLGCDYVMAQYPFASLQGHTTLWNIVNGIGLTFGLRALVLYFERAGKSRTNPLRKVWVQAVVVMFLIWTVELLGGLFFNKLLHYHLWDYSQYEWHGVKLHLWGQITIVYGPFWFVAGLFVRPIYRAVHAAAPAVGDTMATAFDQIEDIVT